MTLRIVFTGLLAAATLVCTVRVHGQAALPKRTGYVTDGAKLLDAHQREELDDTLARFHTRSGSELAVVTVQRLPGGTIERFARRLMKRWDLGAGGGKGILLSVAVKERRMRIEVAAALTAVLTDEECARILADTVKPNFKAANFAAGIELGVEEIIAEVAPEPEAPPDPRAARPAEGVAAVVTTGRPDDGVFSTVRALILLFIATFIAGAGSSKVDSLVEYRRLLGLGMAVIWYCVLQRFAPLPLGWQLAASAGGGLLYFFVTGADDALVGSDEYRGWSGRSWGSSGFSSDDSSSGGSSSSSDDSRGGGASDSW